MQLTEALLDLCKSSPLNSPAFIAIDGPAGAGKTTLAAGLARSFAPKTAAIIHMDDLYNGWSDPFGQEFIDRVIDILQAQKSGRTLDLTYFDWNTHSYSRSAQIKPAQIVILEGVGSGLMEFAPFLNALIWIDIDPEIGLSRVLERDGSEIQKQMKKWLTQQSKLFIANKSYERADFVLTT